MKNKFSKKDIKYMREAIKEAKKALKKNEVPIGAVIVYKNKIIGRGHNLRESKNDPTLHAELIAIKKAAKSLGDWRLTDCTLYATLEPCLMCTGGIVFSRIKKLIYGADDPKGIAYSSIKKILLNKNLNHKIKVVKGLKEEECYNLLRSFFKQIRKREVERWPSWLMAAASKAVSRCKPGRGFESLPFLF